VNTLVDVFLENDFGKFELYESITKNLHLLCSYDPNDKLVSTSDESGNVPLGEIEPLTYTIRFQNTGNFYAEDVRLLDTLDEVFDLETFKFIDASHECEIRFKERTVYFIFEDIFLIDSMTNPIESQGYVTFSIEPTEQNLGQVYSNDAAIYFDLNDPIFTNEVMSVVFDPTSAIENINSEMLDIYPNPATNIIHIGSLNNSAHYSIMNSFGQILKKGEVPRNRQLDISMLNSGIYFIDILDKQTLKSLGTYKICIY